MGGAIFNMGGDGTAQGDLTIVDSTLTGNSAAAGADNAIVHAQGIGGAVFDLNGSFDAVDSTFAGNSADTYASQIYNLGYGQFAFNAQTTLRDTIVFGGGGAATADLAALQFPGSPAGASETTDVTQFDLVGAMNAQSSGAITGTPLTSDPKLGALQNNGGPTETMALGPGSPAIDAGDAHCDALSGAPVATDQRGAARPQGGACDIGAYEVAPPSLTGVHANPTGATSATVSASVNPNAQPTTVVIHYGTTTAYGAATPAQAVAPGTAPVLVSGSITGLRPSTTYHAQVTATNTDGSSASGDIKFTTPGLTLTTAQALNVSGLSETARKWREGSGLPGISSVRPAVGTTFGFDLDRSAPVTFAFGLIRTGREAGGKCVAQTHSNHRHHRCTRTVSAGVLQFAGHAGSNHVRFQGRVTATRKLRPGAYVLTVTATVMGEPPSRPRSIGFTILSR